MSIAFTNQALQMTAWLIALFEVVLGLYVLVLNVWQRANRHASIFLILLSMGTLASGSLLTARPTIQPGFSLLLLAATAPGILPFLLPTVVALIRPEWLERRFRWAAGFFYFSAMLPILLTLADRFLGSHFWLRGYPPDAYRGGFIALASFTQGRFAPAIRALGFSIPLITLGIVLLYLAIFDRQVSRSQRLLAWVMLASAAAVSVIQTLLTTWLHPAMIMILSSLLLGAALAYTSYQQLVAARRLQRGSLAMRLPALMLAVTLPVMAGIAVRLANQASAQLQEASASKIVNTSQNLSQSVSLWLNANLNELEEMVDLPEVRSMDASKQKPVTERIARAFPHMYLVSTTDLNGMNIARNDDVANKDYHDRTWFQSARAGNPLTFQTLIGRTSKQPALVASMPIRDEQGQVIGVGMFASDLDDVTRQVLAAQLGTTGTAFIVDQDNKVVAHTDAEITAQLMDLSDYPPVAFLRGKTSSTAPGVIPDTPIKGEITFTDGDGTRWIALGLPLEHGWAAFVQITEAEFYRSTRLFQRNATLTVAVGALLLFVLAWFTVRQGLRPVGSLIHTASAIAAGDLSQIAPVESDDEIGILARTFNSMTNQLRELVANLERRVAERTRDLEKRALQLQVAAEVAREATAIRELEPLLDHIVRLISERFGFYHAGIFLLDDSGKYAVLRSASSAGGRRLLARGHRLAVGQVGIVGHVAGSGKARIALDVGEDAVYFNNPDMPDTHSELGLPLKVHNAVTGVLDVQSTKAGAFTNEDLEILQVLADQIALAIENARLFSANQEALEELSSVVNLQVTEGWEKELQRRTIQYHYSPLTGKISQSGPPAQQTEAPLSTLEVPIFLRGQRLGSLTLRRDKNQPGWSSDDEELVARVVQQLSAALENARLYAETRQQAQQEKLIRSVSAHVRQTLDIEAILKTAVAEINAALNLDQLSIVLNPQVGDDGQPPA